VSTQPAAPRLGRRQALRVLTASGAALTAGATPVVAAEPLVAPPKALGMLYDTTLCIGCKTCVAACREANNLEADRSGTAGNLHLAPLDLNGRTKNVIKLYREGDQISFVKAQCMHCIDPACASACMLHSLQKDPVTGVVGYDPQYCVGCRYCQMACSFGVPKFEFSKAMPKIVKCELCRHRFPQGGSVAPAVDAEGRQFSRFPRGQGPACCEVCPRGAVIYGTREELLAEARRRLAAYPGRYHVPPGHSGVYGEKEAGGTQVLYLSHVPFEKVGLPALSEESIPARMRAVQHGIYQGFVAPVALYAALGAVMWRNRGAHAPETSEERP
jgi:Fe-S-cluster-containing dehydrogenase component